MIEDLHQSDPQRRYKLMMFHLDPQNGELNGCGLFVSPDGLRWTFTGTMLPAQNAAFLWQDRPPAVTTRS